MKIKYHSSIIRYEGTFPSLSAFFLTAAPEESDSESFQVNAEGNFESDGARLTACYREEDGRQVALSLEHNELTFRRGGTLARFVLSQTTAFSHQTGYGAISVDAHTTRLDLLEMNGSFLLSLVYFAYIGGMMQKNTMKWKFTR